MKRTVYNTMIGLMLACGLTIFSTGAMAQGRRPASNSNAAAAGNRSVATASPKNNAVVNNRSTSSQSSVGRDINRSSTTTVVNKPTTNISSSSNSRPQIGGNRSSNTGNSSKNNGGNNGGNNGSTVRPGNGGNNGGGNGGHNNGGNNGGTIRPGNGGNNGGNNGGHNNGGNNGGTIRPGNGGNNGGSNSGHNNGGNNGGTVRPGNGGNNGGSNSGHNNGGNNGGTVRPGNGGNNGQGHTTPPSGRPNNNKPRPKVGGKVMTGGGPKIDYSTYRYNNSLRPRHDRDRFFDSFRYNSWSWTNPIRPTVRQWRPSTMWVYRPIVTVNVNRYSSYPTIAGVLGLSWGTSFMNAMNYLYYNGYYIDGYENSILYLTDVELLDYDWYDVMLQFDGNDNLDYVEFVSWTTSYDTARFFSLYNYLCSIYGTPVSYANSMYSWYGGDGIGYVNLGYETSTTADVFYTVLAFGI